MTSGWPGSDALRPERFGAVWRELALAPPAALFGALRASYAEPHRANHTAQHIEECLAHLDLARHDAVPEGQTRASW